jgi:hypothetical protein
MRFMALAATVTVATLAACAPPGGGDFTGNPRSCERLFRDFDIADRSVNNFGPRDRFTVPPALDARGQDLRRAGCITSTADLFGLEGLGDQLRGTVQGESGAAIRPISLHVGVVTSMSDEIRVRAFFEALGFRVRSIGNVAIGRRIYLGPFGTEGGLAEATGLARRAGFVAPYPKFF